MEYKYSRIRDVDGTYYVGDASDELLDKWENDSEGQDFVYAECRTERDYNTGQVVSVKWYPVELDVTKPVYGDYKRIVVHDPDPQTEDGV